MTEKKEIGVFEAAYTNVACYLEKEYETKKKPSRLLRNTVTGMDFYLQHLMLSRGLMVDSMTSYFLSPIEVIMEGESLYWGMLSMTPSFNNVFGTMFHYPLSATNNIEMACGMIFDYREISLVYIPTNEKKILTVGLPFNNVGVEQVLNQRIADKDLEKLLNENLDIYSLSLELATIVHDEAVEWAPYEILV